MKRKGVDIIVQRVKAIWSNTISKNEVLVDADYITLRNSRNYWNNIASYYNTQCTKKDSGQLH